VSAEALVIARARWLEGDGWNGSIWMKWHLGCGGGGARRVGIRGFEVSLKAADFSFNFGVSK
jgi:hypothetical protein